MTKTGKKQEKTWKIMGKQTKVSLSSETFSHWLVLVLLPGSWSYFCYLAWFATKNKQASYLLYRQTYHHPHIKYTVLMEKHSCIPRFHMCFSKGVLVACCSLPQYGKIRIGSSVYQPKDFCALKGRSFLHSPVTGPCVDYGYGARSIAE